MSARAASSVWIGCLLLAACDQFASVGMLAPSADAMATRDGGRDTSGERDASVRDAASEDAAVDAGEPCSNVAIAICDPVKNVGCSGALSMQCAIDYARTLTGYCIYTAPPAPGMVGECFNSGITESCPPSFTCFGDRCAKICLCDADCDAGQCCSQPVDATGFSVCGEC